MSFWSRLLQSTDAAAQRRRPRPCGLSLEKLEERWTPAIQAIAGIGTNTITITDSDDGKIHNVIEIIDDLDANKTFIRINNGGETQLGPDGGLATNLTINMGAGNDVVKFTSRGTANAYAENLIRTIDLGAGNDKLLVTSKGAADRNKTGEFFFLAGTNEGNDLYSFTGVVTNGSLVFDGFNAPDASGSDRYVVSLTALNSAVNLSFNDAAGNDVYDVSLFAGYTKEAADLRINDMSGNDVYRGKVGGDSAGLVGLAISDFGTGNDVYRLETLASRNVYRLDVGVLDSGGNNRLQFKQGNLTNVLAQYVSLYFNGEPGTNVVNIGGNAVLAGQSQLSIQFYGGAGRDFLTIDDNSLYDDSLQLVFFTTGGGADYVKMSLNGNARSGQSALDNGSNLQVTGELGDGNDVFVARLYASRWQAGANGGRTSDAALIVRGDAGDDVLQFNAGSRPLRLIDAHLSLDFDGGDGDDFVSVNFARIGDTALSPALITATIKGGAGEDDLRVFGVYRYFSPNVVLHLVVDLGFDSDRDVFRSQFYAWRGVTFSIADVFDYVNATPVDVLNLRANPPGAPWKMVF